MTHCTTIAAAWLLTTALFAQDPLRDIKSKDERTRLVAVEGLKNAGGDDAIKALVAALKDNDWEVQERAAEALGDLKAEDAVKKLADLALKGEIRRVRRAAAHALAAIDAEAGVDLLIKKVKSKRTAVVALEALGRIWARSGTGPTSKLDKLLRHKEQPVREAAAVAWLAGNAEREQALLTLMKHDELTVRAAALDLVSMAPEPADADALVELLGQRPGDDTIERRVIAAAASVARETDESERKPTLDKLVEAAGNYAVRLARLTRLLHRDGVIDDARAIGYLKSCLSADEGARAAAAKVLGELGGEEAAAVARKAAEREAAPRVRYQLVDAVAKAMDAKSKERAHWLCDRASDSDPRVRERAIVWLGDRDLDGAHAVLARTINDSSWRVACSAAVSLGKTYDDRAVKELLTLTKHDDWKRRGAAAVGLMHLNRAASIEPLIELVADTVPMVQRAAHHGLMRVLDHPTAKLDQDEWREFWEKNKATFPFQDWRKIDENRKKYGYAVPDEEIYEGLDVIVFKSRGDHIENLLDKLGIPYRATQANKVAEIGLHPEAVFVSNCTGEIEAGDLEPLQWFVHTGGALFGSCWALTETIAKVHPGVIEKLPTPRGEVLGDVRACACEPESPYLNGVFPPAVTPIYHLEGAHLIRVLDPERAEVLIDSPDAAQTYGGGNLAAWFEVGHGVILDSVNHFDLQGLGNAKDLKSADDRQAYAMDHMGLTYAQWREIRRKAFWKNATKSAQEVPDRSAFRFITNFVRSKRIGR